MTLDIEQTSQDLTAATAEGYFRLATAARDAGCPAEQVRNFFRAGYVPQKKQLPFHANARKADEPDGPTKIAQGGARGSAKSHAAIAQVREDCERYPGLKWLYLRSVGASASESFSDFLTKALPDLIPYYIPSRSLLNFPNGSRIILGGFRSERDLDRYLGIEYDGIVKDDAHLISSSKHQKIDGSLRTSKPDWRPRSYYTFNPGGIGHAYLKKLFVTPWRNGKEDRTRFTFSMSEDNAFLNPEYIEYLESLSGWLYKAWRRGDFDVAAGQFFVNWQGDPSANVHVIEPFEMPGPGWLYWCALDYGFTHPTVVYLFAMTGDGHIYVVDEHWAQRTLVPDHAEGITDMLRRHKLGIHDLADFVAGVDVWSQRGTDKTIAEQYSEEGIEFSRAKTDRIAGAAECMRLLGNPDAGRPPRLQVFSRCTRLVECMPSLEHDPSRPEDVLKVDVDADGDGGDDCLVAGTMIATPKGSIPIEYVTPGTMVMTRKGACPVDAIWNNRLNATVLTVTFSNGATLTGTQNHPVWVDKRHFTFLDSLRYGDIISPYRSISRGEKCQNGTLRQSSLMGLNSGAIQNQNTVAIAAITRLVAITPSEVYERCTLRYGSQFTAMYPLETTFTMPTGIHSITRLTTWCASLLKTMCGCIGMTNAWPMLVSILTPFVHWQAPGIGRMLVEHGIVKTQSESGKTSNPSQSNVRSAVLNLIRLYQDRLAFVLMRANHAGDGNQAWTMKRDTVNGVEMNSHATNMKKPVSAPVRVECVTGERRADTYAMHVRSAHEFYANNILVQNSYDTLRYGMMSAPGTGGLRTGRNPTAGYRG